MQNLHVDNSSVVFMLISFEFVFVFMPITFGFVFVFMPITFGFFSFCLRDRVTSPVP